MPLSELSNEAACYVMNDKCIVEAKVDVPTYQGTYSTCASMASIIKKEHEGQNANYSSPSSAPNIPCFNPVPPFQDNPVGGSEKLCIVPSEATNLIGELMEFRGLGDAEKAFVPLLEEVCSQNPLLIECLHKRNRKVSECALSALGGLLHFLKTTKAKDMTDNACVCLQSLWEDVEMFKFDLAWLEPHVQSVLGMKKCLERARRVKRLRDDVETFDMEKKMRNAALAATEADLLETKRDLEEEEDGFVDTDMDIELGYGMH